ncbi:homeodomain transcription factor [Lithospermum erythrorhizon]|uniref:Homeodomain transcription factor n=1 Tax=Lithospermum erythrorhizon TaxID=34254 RepID=A0AAV3Q8I9_LITER
MEVGFEGEEGESCGGEGNINRPKRQMKTPFQLENLERTYAMENYPTEATRADLSEKLGLTDRQLQMWFCHRRLKDKKEAAGMAAMKPRVPVAFGTKLVPESPKDDMIEAEMGSDHGSRSRSGSGSASESGSSRFDNVEEIPMVPIRYFESPRTIMEQRAIACIEAQLGEPLRGDGPVLGVEFDELPPGAFGAPIVATEQQKPHRPSYDSKLYAQYDSKQIKAISGPKIRCDAYGQVAPSYLYDSAVAGPTSKTLPLMQGNGHRDHGDEGHISNVSILPQQGKEGNNDLIPPIEDMLQLERKRKMEEARMEREVQSNEKRIRKEIEKQDLLRKKREEQLKKEMERQNRERQKEEQRLIREQQRMEERYLREEKREMERREKFMQKELIRAERRKQKEEIRIEREAVKQKLALEKAAARKFAKESMELIEDERLELMELAASSRGLPSILALDYNTLQKLEEFRESLCEFPPKSVKLKKPFAFQPWANSQENIGNLLMVWRFCLTFADILGLWPFTLDEFVQAFHDYDSRLLGEIHIALLKLIIKDIEDVARTPSGGPGTNQYSAVNPEGGHPKLVEGAYLWGFDIRNWQKLLNPLTWPEILRQFSLSAGYGPQLKKKSTEQTSVNDNDETKGCEEIVSNLRSGAAAEKAVAIIQEKGFTLQRKSRHRLTPGTVKFAAYHVLALEGSKGLNVIDLAEKIQRSGLRDLTTSKTPEASISVALSRDPILFERIAPSTYNVRPAYRKDPADAEAILASAREKILKFANGLLTEQNVEEEEEEREDDSECDVAEGPEIEDIGTPDVSTLIELGSEIATSSGTLKDALSVDLISQPAVNGVATLISEPDQEDAEIDESKSGEPWVQGLTEGEYSDLCVEERLKALTALIGVANEGNTVRIVLEDRLDAVNALKKQMWAEAQLDKKRIKEEFISKLQDSSFNVAAERCQSPLVAGEGKKYDTPMTHVVKVEGSITADSVQNPFENTSGGKYIAQDSAMAQYYATPAQQNGYTAERSRMQLKSFIGHKAEEMYVYRSLPLGQDRRRNRYWQFVATASSQDPGSGRIFMESPEGFWGLIDTEEAFNSLLTSLDTRGIRESHLHIMLQKIEGPFRERLHRGSLHVSTRSQNCASKTEAAEENSFSPADSICGSPSVTQCTMDSDALEPSVSFRIELARNEVEKLNAFKRYKNLQIWMWEECFNTPILCTTTYGKKRCSAVLGICDSCLCSYTFEENYCTSCQRSFGKETPLENLKVDPKTVVVLNSPHPTRVGLIRAMFNFLEAFVPSEALQSSWTEEIRKAWGLKLQDASSAEDFIQIMTQFESVIKRDYLSETFETSMELSSYCSPAKNSANVEQPYLGHVAHLPWIPRTTAAVALRLVELDYSISCVPIQKASVGDGQKAEEVMKLPATYGFPNDFQKIDPERLLQEKKWSSMNNMHACPRPRQASRGRGSGGRPRGKSQRVGIAASMSHPGRPTIRRDESLPQTLMQHRERTYSQKHGRGRRTLRKRRIEKKIVQEIIPSHPLEKSTPKIVELPRNTHEDFATPNYGRVESENDDDSNSMDADEYPDNGQDTGFDSRRWEAGFHNSGRNNDVEESSEEDSGDSDSEEEQEPEQDQENGANLDEDVEMNDYDSDRVAAGNEDGADSDSVGSQDYSD